MPEYSWDQNNDEDTPLVKRLRQEIEARDKRLTDLDKTVNELTGRVRTQSVSDLLREIGAKPALAKFIPSGLETTKEAVTAWLKENEDLFGPATPAAPADGQQQVQGEPNSLIPQAPITNLPPATTPEQIAAFQRMSTSDNNTTSLPDVENAQVAQLAAMAQAAGGNVDNYLAYLRGEIKLS